jgi:hypothetical protein
MKTLTTTVKGLVTQISSAVNDANKTGIGIGSTTQDNFFCVICMAPALNCAINLEDDDAEFQLKELFKEVEAVIPKKRLFKVLFLANNRSVFNFECEVEAFNEAGAKIAGNSEVLAERMSLSHFKKPVVTTVRTQVRSAA